jgi:hypothetical protein
MENVIAEKKAWIDGILEKYHRLNEACDDVIDVGAMDIEGPLYKAIWGAWEHLLEQCDHDDWIAWYIHDNDCGERCHRIDTSGSADGIVIDSTEALARFLVEWDRIETDAELQERETYAAALRLHRENNPEAVTGHEGCHWAICRMKASVSDDSEIDLGQVEGKLQQLECERDYALECLAQLHAALVRYEADVDGEAPSEHRRMMDRAASILPENTKASRDEGGAKS